MPHQVARPTIPAYCEALRRDGITPSTLAAYRKNLTAAERELGPLLDVTADAWHRYLPSWKPAPSARRT